MRVGLSEMSSLVDAGVTGVADPDDGDVEDAYAARLTSSAAELGQAVTQPDVAAAYTSLRSSIEELATAVADADDSPESSATLSERVTATNTAGAALMALCANPEDEGMALHRSVLPGLAPRDAVATITPAIQPDGATREVMVLREATGSSFPMYITLEKSESSVWIPASWGRDYKLTFRTNGASETWFSFTDESGDSYLVTVARPRADHTVYYNSDRPAIKGVKGN